MANLTPIRSPHARSPRIRPFDIRSPHARSPHIHAGRAVLVAAALLLAACSPAPLGPPPDADSGPLEAAAVQAEGEAAAAPAGLVRTTWPSAADPGAPFYARIDPAPPFVYAEGGWAAIPFYRDPECLMTTRPDFNLLNFFDPPFAFACPLTVHGASLWHGAVGAGAPMTVISQGDGAVPVWLVPEEGILAALQDGVLTIGELEAIPGRVAGQATFFHEVLHPHPLPPEAGGGGHPVPSINLSARGTLDDGRRFDVHLVRVADETRTLRIRVR